MNTKSDLENCIIIQDPAGVTQNWIMNVIKQHLVNIM